MSLVLVTAPTEEPISLNDAKDQLRVTDTNEHALIEDKIKGARQAAEDFLGRALITQTWDLFLDAFPDSSDTPIKLPYPPLQSVTSVKYTDTTGIQQTLVTTEYTVDTKAQPGRIKPAWGKTWPSIRSEMNAVEIQFVAGYGVDGEDIPPDIINGMLLWIEDEFNHRGSNIVGVMSALAPGTVHSMWWPHRMKKL